MTPAPWHRALGRALTGEELDAGVQDAFDADAAVAALSAEGFSGVVQVPFEATDTDGHGMLIDSVFDGGDIDVVVLAAGITPTPEVETDAALARDVGMVNFVSLMQVGTEVVQRLRSEAKAL